LGAAALFAALHLYFALGAIFVSDVGPLAASQRSVGVVRRHLLASSALILLTWLILAGMDRVWELVASTVQAPFGIALGILGNAYIASGLIAASMIFYTERVEAPPSAAAANALQSSYAARPRTERRKHTGTPSRTRTGARADHRASPPALGRLHRRQHRGAG